MKSISMLVLVALLAACHTGGETKTEPAKESSTASEWELTDERLRAGISKAEFVKLYGKEQNKLGEVCAMPASVYCQKTSKDLQISESEFSCLWQKVYRVTRERLPQLDNTPCAAMIQSYSKQ